MSRSNGLSAERSAALPANWCFLSDSPADNGSAGDTVRPVLEFGLTGGIGSGKSTVGSLLAGHGAVIIDADAIVRILQAPGELVFEAMVSRWGDTIVREDGTLDRGAVASIVFSDADELAALNAIVHPAWPRRRLAGSMRSTTTRS